MTLNVSPLPTGCRKDHWTNSSEQQSVVVLRPKTDTSRKVEGAFKVVISGELFQVDQSPISIVSAKPRLLKGNISHNDLATKSFQREEEIFETCKNLGVEGLAYPIGLWTYTAQNGQKKLRMIFPRYNQGDLCNIMPRIYHISSPIIKSAQDQLLRIGSSLEQTGCIHRDIKPENCLWHSETDQTVKIGLCDVSMMRLPQDPTKIIMSGSRLYIAPEYAHHHLRCQKELQAPFLGPQTLQDIKKRHADELSSITTHKIDAWGFGILLACLEDPHWAFHVFNTSNELEVFPLRAYWYKNKNISKCNKPPEENSMMYIIWKLLQPHPDDRDSCSQAYARFRNLPENREITFKARQKEAAENS